MSKEAGFQANTVDELILCLAGLPPDTDVLTTTVDYHDYLWQVDSAGNARRVTLACGQVIRIRILIPADKP